MVVTVRNYIEMMVFLCVLRIDCSKLVEIPAVCLTRSTESPKCEFFCKAS